MWRFPAWSEICITDTISVTNSENCKFYPSVTSIPVYSLIKLQVTINLLSWDYNPVNHLTQHFGLQWHSLFGYVSPLQCISSCCKSTTEGDACLLNCGFSTLASKRSLVQEAIILFLTLKNNLWLILYHEQYYTNMRRVRMLKHAENIDKMTYSLEI